MIDISQLTTLISAFRIESEKESISPEPRRPDGRQTVGKFLQDIADLLASVPSQNNFNILRYWEEPPQQYRFIYDILQRSVEDNSYVMLSLLCRSLLNGKKATV